MRLPAERPWWADLIPDIRAWATAGMFALVAFILHLIATHPELQDSQVAKLVGSTKSTVQSVKDRSHWNMQNLRPRDPVTLGLCTLKDLNDAVDRARRKAARVTPVQALRT